MSESILTSVKKVLGIGAEQTEFDVDILMHINSVFSTLNQLGIGPTAGLAIEDATPTWDTLLGGDPRLNSVKSYVYLKVRMLFDPPGTSYLIDAMKKQADELEWRLSVVREGDDYVDPNLEDTDILDGGSA